MTDYRPLAEALGLLVSDDYRMGAGWRRAHAIAQAHEGDPLFDRLHALCHRIEGDDGNAAYWYRRAGMLPAPGPVAAEGAALARAAGV